MLIMTAIHSSGQKELQIRCCDRYDVMRLSSLESAILSCWYGVRKCTTGAEYNNNNFNNLLNCTQCGNIVMKQMHIHYIRIRPLSYSWLLSRSFTAARKVRFGQFGAGSLCKSETAATHSLHQYCMRARLHAQCVRIRHRDRACAPDFHVRLLLNKYSMCVLLHNTTRCCMRLNGSGVTVRFTYWPICAWTCAVHDRSTVAEGACRRKLRHDNLPEPNVWRWHKGPRVQSMMQSTVVTNWCMALW